MKRILINFFLVFVILSVLILPAFAVVTDSDDIVILRQLPDVITTYKSDGRYHFTLSIVALGNDLSYNWQYSDDLVNWYNLLTTRESSVQLTFPSSVSDRYVRCKVISGNDFVYSRVALVENPPASFFNFIGSCLRYITSYVSLIINSLVTPGAPLFPLLPILAVGIAVAFILLVIKIFKNFTWGL